MGPQGAKKASEGPKGAKPANKSMLAEAGSQFVGGLNDVTGMLATPFQAVFGDAVIGGPEGVVEFRGPEEALARRGEIGLPGRATEEPTGMVGRGMRIAGQTAAAGPILGRALGFVSQPAQASTMLGRVGGFFQKTASTAGASFARAPGVTTAVETGLGFTAGATGFVAGQMFPDSDAAVFVGDIIGGTLPALTPTSLAIKAAGGTRNLFNRIRKPFTPVGGKKRAAARVQRSVPEDQRGAAVDELGKATTIDPETGDPVLTTAQRSSEPGILSLERAIMESSEQLTRDADAQIARANDIIQRSLADLGDSTPAAAQSQIEDAHKYLDSLLDARVRIAAQRTAERIDALGPSATREQTNLIADAELRSALRAGRTQERELYQLIPEDAPTPFTQVKTRFDAFRRDLGRAQSGDVPAIAKRFLNDKSDDFFGNIEDFPDGTTSIKELRALQGKLREVSRNARAGDSKNLNKARIADSLADAITEDVAHTQAGPEVADAVQTAVEFSRNLHERFSRGTVGKLLGRRVAGDPSVPPGLSLEESIGMAGPKARVALDDLMRAFDSPEAPGSDLIMSATQDHIRHRFLMAAVEQGNLNVRSARRFINQNQEILNRLPGLRRQMQEAVDSGDLLALSSRQRSRVTLDDPRVSKATMLIEKGPVDTFRSIARLKPQEAARETQSLINRTLRDSTGEALAGLKSGFVQFLLSGSRLSGRDVTGRSFLSGFALRDLLEEPGTRAAVNRLFSKEELNRIGILTRDLIRMERRRGATIPAEGIIGDKPSKLVDTMARMTGAGVGGAQSSRIGVGGEIQMANIMSTRFRELADAFVKNSPDRLLRDAILDDKLFKELLQAELEEGGKKLPDVARQRLNAWAAAVLAENGGAFEEQ